MCVRVRSRHVVVDSRGFNDHSADWKIHDVHAPALALIIINYTFTIEPITEVTANGDAYRFAQVQSMDALSDVCGRVHEHQLLG